LGRAAAASAGVPSTGKQESHDIDGFEFIAAPNSLTTTATDAATANASILVPNATSMTLNVTQDASFDKAPDNTLVIRGKSVVLLSQKEDILTPLTANEADNEEIYAQNGMLEEIIDIQYADIHTDVRTITASIGCNSSNCNDMSTNTALDPNESQKIEVLNILTDAVWPDLVTQLEPLVRQIVLESSSHGLELYTEQEEHEEEQGHRDEGDGSLFDHGW
jgi:hypothetical protein